jgi:hypothetical protein
VLRKKSKTTTQLVWIISDGRGSPPPPRSVPPPRACFGIPSTDLWLLHHASGWGVPVCVPYRFYARGSSEQRARHTVQGNNEINTPECNGVSPAVGTSMLWLWPTTKDSFKGAHWENWKALWLTVLNDVKSAVYYLVIADRVIRVVNDMFVYFGYTSCEPTDWG